MIDEDKSKAATNHDAGGFDADEAVNCLKDMSLETADRTVEQALRFLKSLRETDGHLNRGPHLALLELSKRLKARNESCAELGDVYLVLHSFSYHLVAFQIVHLYNSRNICNVLVVSLWLLRM